MMRKPYYAMEVSFDDSDPSKTDRSYLAVKKSVVYTGVVLSGIGLFTVVNRFIPNVKEYIKNRKIRKIFKQSGEKDERI